MYCCIKKLNKEDIMKITRKIQSLAIMLSLALILGLAFANVSAPLNAEKDTAKAENPGRVVVTGDASIKVKPDVAYINVGVETKNKDAKLAQEENAKVMNAVIAKLKEKGIKDEEIQTSNYNIYERYNYSSTGNRVSEGYVVNASITITVNDVTKAGEIFDLAVKNGANQANGISFDIKDRTKVYNEALKLAMKNASGKAEAIMSTFGAKVGKPALVEEFYSESRGGYYGYGAYDMNMEMKSAETAIQAGELAVNCKLTVTYEY